MLLAAAVLSLTLHDVTVIDTVRGRAIPARTVHITNGRITSRAGAGARVIHAKGKFLIPGLWDMHIHFRGGAETVAGNEAFLPLFLAHGVTAVREMGGDLNEHVFRWRAEIERKARLGPRIFTSGPKLDGPKPAWPGSIPVSNAEDARKAVRQVHAMGADLVKLYFDALPEEVLKAITDEARKFHLPVAGHNARNLTIRQFLRAGVGDVQHTQYYLNPGCSPEEAAIAADFEAHRTMTMEEWSRRMHETCDPQLAADLIRFLRQRRAFVTPTLARIAQSITVGLQDYSNDPRRVHIAPSIWKTWDPLAGRRRVLSEEARALRARMNQRAMEFLPRLQAAGVPILAGSDCGASNNYSFPGSSLHEELEALVGAGLTPAQALAGATIDAARYFHLEASYGSIEKGKSGDLVLLDGNPLEDIRNIRKIAAVIRNTEYLVPDELLKVISR